MICRRHKLQFVTSLITSNGIFYPPDTNVTGIFHVPMNGASIISETKTRKMWRTGLLQNDDTLIIPQKESNENFNNHAIAADVPSARFLLMSYKGLSHHERTLHKARALTFCLRFCKRHIDFMCSLHYFGYSNEQKYNTCHLKMKYY